jgi:hypothetical protein
MGGAEIANSTFALRAAEQMGLLFFLLCSFD